MRKEEERKEILTYANIRRDLRRRLWKSWCSLIVCLSAMVGFIWAFHQLPELLFRSSSRYHMPGWMTLLLMPFVLYVVIKEALVVSCGFRRKLCITRAKLGSSEGDSSTYYRMHGWRTYWCTLHFRRYGDYSVPEKNYQWSKINATTARGIHNMAFEGNEYYLVLSRPNSGKILLVYDTKLFQLEGEPPTEE